MSAWDLIGLLQISRNLQNNPFCMKFGYQLMSLLAFLIGQLLGKMLVELQSSTHYLIKKIIQFNTANADVKDY